VGCLVMERLERRSAVLIDRDDLTIEQHGLGPKPCDLACDGRILACGVLQVPRQQLDSRSILQREGAVAVPLHFV
jgi:hypothetical protein